MFSNYFVDVFSSITECKDEDEEDEEDGLKITRKKTDEEDSIRLATGRTKHKEEENEEGILEYEEDDEEDVLGFGLRRRLTKTDSKLDNDDDDDDEEETDIELEDSDDDDTGLGLFPLSGTTGSGYFARRVFRAALPIQALMVLLLGAASLVPMTEQDFSCILANNLRHSLDPVLDYMDGQPPF